MVRRWRLHLGRGGSRYSSARRIKHDRPTFHGSHAFGVKQGLPLHEGEVRARASVLSPPNAGRTRLQAAEQGVGGLGRWESPLDGPGGVGQHTRGQLCKPGDPGVLQRLCLLCFPLPP